MSALYRNVDHALRQLSLRVLRGDATASRVGDTRETTFAHFAIRNPLDREITLPDRKANLAAQIAETMWVLAGRDDVEWLSYYLPRAAEFSDDGQTWRAGYGPRLRKWETRQRGLAGERHHADQMENVAQLLREDPTTRRAVMSIWDPAVDTQPSKDIPCNNWLHFLARDGVLNLHVAIRSNDLIWGWSGINQFEWSVLLEVMAAYTGLKVGRIIYAVSSLHIYDRHFAKAEKLARSSSYPRTFAAESPRFDPRRGCTGEEIMDFRDLLEQWFKLEEAIRTLNPSHGCTGAGCAGCELGRAIERFPEPMLRSWLRVLQWWWSGSEFYLEPLAGTRLHAAALVAVQPSHTATVADEEGTADPLAQPPSGRDLAAAALRGNASDEAARRVEAGGMFRGHRFLEEVTRLHIEKDAAYGTSWKKRGELFSILPNIARKVDRLGSSDTTDENQTDTAVDLMVYLAKYRTWLGDRSYPAEGQLHSSDKPAAANLLLGRVAKTMDLQEHPWTTTELEDYLRDGLDHLMRSAENHTREYVDRATTVDVMLQRAYVLARRRWNETPAVYRGADHE